MSGVDATLCEGIEVMELPLATTLPMFPADTVQADKTIMLAEHAALVGLAQMRSYSFVGVSLILLGLKAVNA